MTKKILLLVLTVIMGTGIMAQPINVPSISSQYINQANDHSAIKLYLKYDKTSQKAYFLINKEEKAFSQKIFNAHIKEENANLRADLAKQVAVQVHAPKDMPEHYLQDLYTWLQIQGSQRMHIVGREGSQLLYVPVHVMPFGRLEAACKYYAQMNGLEDKTAVEILNIIHPNTSEISILQEDEELAAVPQSTSKRRADYIPHRILDITIKEGNNVYYKGQKVNPTVLGTMLQSEVATNYKGAITKASPSQFFWVNMTADKTVSHEVYLNVLVAVQEAFYLYWDELSFNKYQKTYGELSLEESIRIKDTSPMLITQYDTIQYSYIKAKLEAAKGKVWEELD